MTRAPYPIIWGKAVTDSSLARRERLVCLALLLHMDIRGVCRPTIATIARRSGYGETSVKRALNLLERLAWITRSSGRTGRASVYAGLIPVGTPERPPGRHPRAPTKSPEKKEELDDIPF